MANLIQTITDFFSPQKTENDDDQNFIDKQDPESVLDIDEFESKKNQQRNLSRENGGLEQEDSQEIDSKDGTKDKEEVLEDPEQDKQDELEAENNKDEVHIFNTTHIKSVVNQKKKDRLEDLAENALEAADAANKSHRSQHYQSATGNSFAEREMYRQERSNNQGHSGERY